MIIAIDGPAGSGKSTVARQTAKALGYQCVDTGAMYRAITWKAMKQGINLENETELALLTQKSCFRFLTDEKDQLVLELDGEDVSSVIRQQTISENVSKVSKHPAVRKEMVAWQRRLAQKGNVVVEGRDIGTVVFPNAERKFFIEAKLEARVQRRYEELKRREPGVTLESVGQEVAGRDYRDRHREVSPLTKAPDAIYIDTTSLTPERVVEKILKYVL